MDDIVERLQSHINLRMGATTLSAGPDNCSVTMADARDEIERLREALAGYATAATQDMNDVVQAGIENESLRTALSQARNDALEEAAGVADIYSETKPNFENSTNHRTARLIACIMSDTGKKVAAAIRALKTSEERDDKPLWITCTVCGEEMELDSDWRTECGRNDCPNASFINVPDDVRAKMSPDRQEPNDER